MFETNVENLQEKNHSWLIWLKTLSLLKLLTSLYEIFPFDNLPLLQSLLLSVQREKVVLRCLWASYHGLHLYYICLLLIHFIHIWCHIIKFIHHISWPYKLIKVFPVEFACLLQISLAASTEKLISTFASWSWKSHKLIALTECIIKHVWAVNCWLSMPLNLHWTLKKHGGILRGQRMQRQRFKVGVIWKTWVFDYENLYSLTHIIFYFYIQKIKQF